MSVLAPGVYVTSTTSPTTSGIPTDSARAFVAGVAAKGPIDKAVRVRSITEFEQHFGTADPSSYLYVAIDTAFREGLSEALVSRIVGPSPVLATAVLEDATDAVALTATAINPGPWANGVTLATASASPGVVLTVTNGSRVETSPVCTTLAELVGWSQGSTIVRLTAGAGTALPAVGTVTLGGGTDDRASITIVQKVAALDRFKRADGPGNVAIPGDTAQATHEALMTHALSANRHAVLDLVDSTSAATIATSVSALRSHAGAAYASAFAPWAKVPGVSGTLRTVPWSAVQLGIFARADAASGPHKAAAGRKYPAQSVVDLTATFSDQNRAEFAVAGINPVVELYGLTTAYAVATLAKPDVDPVFSQNTASRMRMLLIAEAEAVGQNYFAETIDGKGHTLDAFASAISAILLRHYGNDALYGDTPSEAYLVNVANPVNTPATAANKELRAEIAVKISPVADRVLINLAVSPLTQSL